MDNTEEMIPVSKLKAIIYKHRILDKQFEDCTKFENDIVELAFHPSKHNTKLWMGEYDHE